MRENCWLKARRHALSHIFFFENLTCLVFNISFKFPLSFVIMRLKILHIMKINVFVMKAL